MGDLIFHDAEEARAWDMYVAGALACPIVLHNGAIDLADLAILERRKRMAPPESKPEREWIPHKPGDPMPCDGYAQIEYKHRNGRVFPATVALHVPWATECADDYKVEAWRPA
jgi:hypothetical protein